MKRLLLALPMLLQTGCRPTDPTAQPSTAVAELLVLLRASDGSIENARAIYALLSLASRENLGVRAERYSAASGKRIEPELMVAPESYVERFAPVTFQSEREGNVAKVRVSGLGPDEKASIPCVFEEGGWRIDVVLPELPPPVIRPRE